METQAAQNQEQEPRSYENSPWINVYDWQVTEHTNRETGDSFWSVKLASDAFVEHDGRRIDVGRHVFTTNYEPSVTRSNTRWSLLFSPSRLGYAPFIKRIQKFISIRVVIRA